MVFLLGAVFVASLLGSLHCVGMCGPFALLAGSSGSKRGASWKGTALYSLGRLLTYSVVGVLFGIIGLALNESTSFAPWQQTATYVAGFLMIAVGLIALARYMGFRLKIPLGNGWVQSRLKGLHKFAGKRSPAGRAFLIGALSSLMPCGWLYTFAIVAAGTGHPLWGVLVMVVFWAGTLPIMIALALGISRLSLGVQKRLPVAMASLVILIGVFTIAFRAPIAIGADTFVTTDRTEMIRTLNNMDQEELPCCKNE